MARTLRLRRPSAWHLALVPLALVMLVPLIWMLITSLSTLAETHRFPPGLPSSLHWESYSQAWNDSPLAHWLVNSTIVSVTCVVSNLVLCSLAGYAFARIPLAGSRIMFLGILLQPKGLLGEASALDLLRRQFGQGWSGNFATRVGWR